MKNFKFLIILLFLSVNSFAQKSGDGKTDWSPWIKTCFANLYVSIKCNGYTPDIPDGKNWAWNIRFKNTGNQNSHFSVDSWFLQTNERFNWGRWDVKANSESTHTTLYYKTPPPAQNKNISDFWGFKITRYIENPTDDWTIKSYACNGIYAVCDYNCNESNSQANSNNSSPTNQNTQNSTNTSQNSTGSSGTSSMNRGGNIVTGNSTNTNSEGTGWNGNNSASNQQEQQRIQQELVRKEQQFVDKYNEGVRLGNSGNYEQAAEKYQEAISLAINETDRRKAQDAYNSVLKTNRTIITINTVGNVIGDVLDKAIEERQKKLEADVEKYKKQAEIAKMEMIKNKEKEKYYNNINNLLSTNSIYKYAIIDLILNELHSIEIPIVVKDDLIKISKNYLVLEQKEAYEEYKLNLNNGIKINFITYISEHFYINFYFDKKETVNKILNSKSILAQLLKGDSIENEDFFGNKFFSYKINPIDLITSDNYSKTLNNLQKNNLNISIDKIKYLGVNRTIQNYELYLKSKSVKIFSKTDKSKEDYLFLAKEYYPYLGNNFEQYKNYQLAYLMMSKNDNDKLDTTISILNLINGLKTYYKDEINTLNINEYIKFQINDFSNIFKNEIGIEIFDKLYQNRGKEIKNIYIDDFIKYFYENKDIILNDKFLVDKISEIEFIESPDNLYKFKLYIIFGDIAYKGIKDGKIDWGKAIENYIIFFNNKGYNIFSGKQRNQEASSICQKISNMYETGGINLESNKKLSKEWSKKAKEFK